MTTQNENYSNAKEQKRKEKEKQRAVRQASAAVAKGMKKENWMEYMEVLIDTKLASQKGGTEMVTALELEGMKCDVSQHDVPNTIHFIRTELSADEEGAINRVKIREDVVLLVDQAEQVGTMIQQRKLVEHIKQSADVCQANVCLIVMGHERLMKSKKVGVIKRLEWERGLLDLQLELNVTTYCLTDITQLLENVRMFCKALGERPHKLRTSKDLFIESSKQTLFVDAKGNGYMQVFIAQLQDIRSVNEAIASAVAQQYPSPSILLKFITESGEESAVNTIADIPVRRGVGSLASVRRVGPEAAKRIVTFYNNTNPDLRVE